MLQRPTQTAAFWRDQFEVTADDTDFLYQLLLDAQKPIKLSDLAVALIKDLANRMLRAEDVARDAEKRAQEAEQRAAEAEKRLREST